jgi:hypothetical protein
MELEERVRRLEQSNRGLRVVLIGLLLVLVLWQWFHGKIPDILVGKQVTTGWISMMDQIGPHQKPRFQLFPTPTGTLMCFVGSDNTSLLTLGIKKDPKQGEIPMIIFQTKAGTQTLAPNAEGKMVMGEVQGDPFRDRGKKAIPGTK